MEFTYTPSALIAAKEMIIKQHSEESSVSDIRSGSEFKNLIQRLTTMSEADVKIELILMSPGEKKAVAQYISGNEYNVKLDNLFLVIQSESDRELYQIFWSEWQDFYNNEQCNTFLRKLLDEERSFGQAIVGPGWSLITITGILIDKNIPQAFLKELNTKMRIHRSTLQGELSKMGIRPDSKLAEKIETLHYMQASMENYLKAGEANICRSVKNADLHDQRLLLQNFLKEMKWKDLRKMDDLAKLFLEITGDPYSKKFKAYCGGFSTELTRKYADWINGYKIRRSFGKDERGAFWEAYRMDTVTTYNNNNVLIMDFGDYVAVEFVDKISEPCFFFRKKYFVDTIIKRGILKDAGGAKIKSYVKYETSYRENVAKFTLTPGIALSHVKSPEWQKTFAEVIRNNSITRMLFATVSTSEKVAADSNDPIINLLIATHTAYVDNRSKGGALWAIGGKELASVMNSAKSKGYIFKYAANGGKASGGKPAWYYK